MKLPVKSLVGLVAVTLLFACKPKETPSGNPVADQPETAAPAAAAPATPAATPAPETAPVPAAPAASAAPAPAPTPAGWVRYEAQSTGSKMTIAGTSTIHDWTMESAVVGGSIEADAKFPEAALTDPAAAKPVVQVFMPVRSFKSYAKKMDQVMQEHMKEPEFKRIEYKLIELKPKSVVGTTGKLEFEATGTLTIAGTTKTNTMPVSIEKVDGTKLKITGATGLKMTEYGVKPPAPTILGMPTISTGDEVKLTFEWIVAPKAKP
jgi:polyisoprenoid-binding protein YceI